METEVKRAPRKTHLNYNEVIMTVATAVMAFATVVMMYSGCQQTRANNSLEKITENEDKIKLLTAKRELRRVILQVSDIFSNNGTGIIKLNTLEQCTRFSKKITDVMEGVSDNYFLLSNKEQAFAWENMIEGLKFYQFPYNCTPDDEKIMVKGFNDEAVIHFRVLMQIYESLELLHVTPPNERLKRQLPTSHVQ